MKVTDDDTGFEAQPCGKGVRPTGEVRSARSQRSEVS